MNGMKAARAEVAPWIRGLARAGFVAKGIQYATIGLLAAMAAIGDRAGRTTGSKGALAEIHAQPFGKVLLGIMAIGLAGYAVWRFVEAVLDPEHRNRGASGALKRVGKFANALLHGALVVYAVGVVTGKALADSDDGTKSWTGRILTWELGPWLVGAAGIGVIVFAAVQMKKAWSCKLDEQLDLGRLGHGARRVVVQLSRFGLGARAFVFALVGAFLVSAAFRSDPNRAKGLGDALATVRGWSFGGAILGVVAVGLIAYGMYEMVEARYRRIKPV